jgi:ADP-heptose:LPS heptosyltransferase/glycosyltransferase involved in cell wall biosynthesis
MRFISAKSSCKLESYGAEFILNPLSYPDVNINDILAAEYGYVVRTVHECPHIQEIKFDVNKIPGFPRRIDELSQIETEGKLLLMRVGGLGDMVMLTPVLRYLQQKLPNGMEITLSTFNYSHDLFIGSGLCDRVVSAPLRLSQMLDYDYYIEFIEESEVGSFSSLNMTDFYFSSINVDPNGLAAPEKEPFLPETIAANQKIIDIMDNLKNSYKKPLVLACLASSDPTRNIPTGHFESLLQAYPEVLFVVPPHNNDIAAKLEALNYNNLLCIDTSHRLSSFLTAIRYSDLVLSADSSAYHLAAAFRKPALALFGSINPDYRIRYYPTVKSISGRYRGEFCTSPCGMSNAAWIKLDDKAGQEIMRRNLFAPIKGCPEAVKHQTESSPCLLAIDKDDLNRTFCSCLDLKRDVNHKKTGRILLSACMIVKNEEAFLPQCLESIKEVVDEIVIVDTGSTDRTVEIASFYGAKIYHHPWEHDFSKHRNQSISYATGEWIMIIDADEKLDPDSRPLIKNAVAKTKGSLIAVTVNNFAEGGSVTSGAVQVRIFRNGMGIGYSGIVHNQLNITSTPAYYPIILWHYGYDLGDENNKKKRERSLILLLKQMEMNPEDRVARHHLAVTYFAAHEYAPALEHGLKTLEINKRQHTKGKGWTHFIVAFSLYKLGRIEEACEQALDGIRDFPLNIDLYYLLSRLSFENKDYAATRTYSDKYLSLKKDYEENPTPFGMDVFEMNNREDDVLLVRGFAEHQLGNPETARHYLDKIIPIHRPDRNVKLRHIGVNYRNQNDYDDALHFFQAMDLDGLPLDEAHLSIPFCLEKLNRYTEALQYFDCLATTYPDQWLVHYQRGQLLFRRKMFPEASDSLANAHSLNQASVDILIDWGLSLISLNKMDTAVEKFLLALAQDENNPAAILNLGLLYYEQFKFEKALPFLTRAWNDNPRHSYSGLALSAILAEANLIEDIVPLCSRLMANANLSTDAPLERVFDLGVLYFLLAGHFLENRSLPLFHAALRTATLLTSDDYDLKMELAKKALRLGENDIARMLVENHLPKSPVSH